MSFYRSHFVCVFSQWCLAVTIAAYSPDMYVFLLWHVFSGQVYLFTVGVCFITDLCSHYSMGICCYVIYPPCYGDMLCLRLCIFHYSLVVTSDQICSGVRSKEGFFTLL